MMRVDISLDENSRLNYIIEDIAIFFSIGNHVYSDFALVNIVLEILKHSQENMEL